MAVTQSVTARTKEIRCTPHLPRPHTVKAGPVFARAWLLDVSQIARDCCARVWDACSDRSVGCQRRATSDPGEVGGFAECAAPGGDSGQGVAEISPGESGQRRCHRAKLGFRRARIGGVAENLRGRRRRETAAGSRTAVRRKPSSAEQRSTRLLRRAERPQGETHWSCRSMAKAAGVSPATVQRVWSSRGLKPHLVRTWYPTTPAGEGIDVVAEACTSTRPTKRWCCVWMRSLRCRRWTAPRRRCR